MNIPGADSLLAWIVRWRCYRLGQPPVLNRYNDYTNSQRILLVLTTGLGDTVLSSAAFSGVRTAYPRAEIRLFCRSAWLGLFINDPRLDGLLPYFGKYRRFFKTIAGIRSFAPDLTLILHGNDPDIIPLLFLSGCQRIVRIPNTKTRFRYLLANRERHVDENCLDGLHYVDNRLRIFDTLGIKTNKCEPCIYLPARSTNNSLPGLLPGSSYWVYHAFSANHFKDWPTDNIAPLLRESRRRWPRLDIVLTGGAKDRKALASVTTQLADTGIVNLAGTLSIRETAQILACSKVVVAPDTGVLHLAASLGTPTISLYASTNHRNAGPRPQTSRQVRLQKELTCRPCLAEHCKYHPATCMAQIGVDEVLAGLQEMIATGDARNQHEAGHG